MICLDVSSTSVKTLVLSKNFLGKYSIRSLNKISIAGDREWEEKIKPFLKNKKVSFIIPDSKVFLQRFSIEKNLAKNQIPSFIVKNLEGLIPMSLAKLIYNYVLLDGEIIFFGIAYKELLAYSKFYQKFKAEISLAVPESFAVFEIIKDQIEKDKAVSYIDIGAETADVSFFDSFGPISSFAKPMKIEELEEEMERLFDFFEKKHQKQISKIIFGGGGSLPLDINSLKQKYQPAVVQAETILQNEFKSLKIKPGQEKYLVFFINILGLAKLAAKKTSFNLFQKEEMAKMEKREKIRSSEKKAIEKNQVKKEEIAASQTEGREPKKPSCLLVFLLILIILGAPALGVYYYFFGQKPDSEIRKEEAPAAPTAEPTIEPTASPAVEVLPKENLKIQILNGSGTEGEAAVAAQLLRDKGYLEDIETDNADSYDYEESMIQIKEERINYFEELKKDLGTEYAVSDDYELLDTDNDFDVIIIIGSERS